MDDHKELREAQIVINGVELNFAQSMTIRVAIASFLMDLEDPDHLGEDEHGRIMTQGYRTRATEIQNIIFKAFNTSRKPWESQAQGSYSPYGRSESETIRQLSAEDVEKLNRLNQSIEPLKIMFPVEIFEIPHTGVCVKCGHDNEAHFQTHFTHIRAGSCAFCLQTVRRETYSKSVKSCYPSSR